MAEDKNPDRGVSDRGTSPASRGLDTSKPGNTGNAPAPSPVPVPKQEDPKVALELRTPQDDYLLSLNSRLRGEFVYRFGDSGFDAGDRDQARRIHQILSHVEPPLTRKSFAKLMYSLGRNAPEVKPRLYALSREDGDLARLLVSLGVSIEELTFAWKVSWADGMQFILGVLLGIAAELGVSLATAVAIGALVIVAGALVAIATPELLLIIAGATAAGADEAKLRSAFASASDLVGKVVSFLKSAKTAFVAHPGEAITKVLAGAADYGIHEYDTLVDGISGKLASFEFADAGYQFGRFATQTAFLVMGLGQLAEMMVKAAPKLRLLTKAVAEKTGLLKLLLTTDLAAIEGGAIEGLEILKLPNHEIVVRGRGLGVFKGSAAELEQWHLEAVAKEAASAPPGAKAVSAAAQDTARARLGGFQNGVPKALTKVEEMEVQLLAAQLEDAARLLDKRFTDMPHFGEAWSEMLQGKPNIRGYPEARTEFWRQIAEAKTPATRAAKDVLTRSGFAVEGGAPTLRLPGPNGPIDLKVSIDHIAEQATNPALAIDPRNLRLVSLRENTVVLNQTMARDPFIPNARMTSGRGITRAGRIMGYTRDANGIVSPDQTVPSAATRAEIEAALDYALTQWANVP